MAGGNPTNAGGAPSDPLQPPSGPLAQALHGHWYSDGPVGNCVAFRDYYSFAANGTVENLGIDHNACSGDRLLSQVAGRYRLDGRELEITLDGPGSDRVLDMPELVGDVAQRVQRMNIAIGERAGTDGRPAQTYLDAKAFTSRDGYMFSSVRSDVYVASDGTTRFAQKVFVTYHLSLALDDLAVGDTVNVRATVQLTQSNPGDPTQHENDQLSFSYNAVVREALGWRWITAQEVDGKSNEAAIAAWQQVLVGAGVATHPDWARRLLEFHFFPVHRYQPGDVTVLSSTLPEYGHWTRAAEAPVVPANAP